MELFPSLAGQSQRAAAVGELLTFAAFENILHEVRSGLFGIEGQDSAHPEEREDRECRRARTRAEVAGFVTRPKTALEMVQAREVEEEIEPLFTEGQRAASQSAVAGKRLFAADAGKEA